MEIQVRLEYDGDEAIFTLRGDQEMVTMIATMITGMLGEHADDMSPVEEDGDTIG